MKSSTVKPLFLAVGAAFAMLAAPAAFQGIAHAQDGTPKGRASQGPSADHGSRGANQPGEIGGRGQGQGSPDESSDAKGPRYGGGGAKPEAGTQGGQKPWTAGAIPEDVELGRLNVARSPAQVIDRALTEALATIDPSFYNQASLDAVIATIKDPTSTLVRIDSPLQNLGLYKDLLTDGQIGDGTKVPVTASNYVMLAAIFVGGAADKTIPITVDTVNAINTIMGLTLPSSVSVEQVAASAEAVRAAILEAHGE